MSDMSRHTPRKCARPWRGEWSAPSVMFMPEPMPLPKPIASATSNSVTTPAVKGINSIAAPMMSIDGTATQRRPLMSITLPAG